MHSQHILALSPQVCSIIHLPEALPPFHPRSCRWHSLASRRSSNAAGGGGAGLLSHARARQRLKVHALRGSNVGEDSELWRKRQWQEQPRRGLRRVSLLRIQRRRTSYQAGKEADSIEDLNLEELDDEQLDELFETYGEVVERVQDSPPDSASSEVDADAESLAFAVALAGAANDVKAGEIQVLFVKPLVYWTRFFVIATGFSRPQVSAIGKKMRDVAEERYKKFPRGDLKPNAWTLLDFGDVVVHIFYPKERAFYNLEEFYANATVVDLPFDTQSTIN